MAELLTVPPADDLEFEELPITEVRHERGNWYLVKRADGWSLGVETDIAPQVGQIARYYGKGIGFPVRGVVIDGRTVYYRKAADEEQHRRDLTYPRTAADALIKWDAGDSLFTVELGGLGPGYEQAIQITLFEVIRACVSMVFTGQHSTDVEAFHAIADKAINKIDGKLGLSGAQAGAAKSLAFHVLRDGWQKTILSAPDDQRIQVSKDFPSL